jgi:hypothetical protein
MHAEETWVDYFADLERLVHLDPATPEFGALYKRLSTVAEEREREGLKRKDSLEKCRARVVRFHLQRLRGIAAHPATEPETEPVWVPHEAWFATRALVPGFFRVQAAIAALDEAGRSDVGRSTVGRSDLDGAGADRLEWAARVAAEERELGRLELAERAATAVFAHAPDARSALRLARILALRGSADEARAVLGHGILGSGILDSADERARLLLERARVSSGVHDERGALRDWGAALRLGSDDAALDLAWRALFEGETARAEILGRAVLAGTPLREDALAVWGRALLPGAARGPDALTRRAGKVP